MARPGGLGRGLGALIPTGQVEEGGDPSGAPGLGDHGQPGAAPRALRRGELGALAESIREVGVLQPVLVRERGDGYELIAGERRWRAARRIGLQTIPAIVRHADDAGVLQQAIIENVQREQLNPLEEAAAYQQLIEDFSLTHDDVAARVGKSRATVTNMLRLLQLPPSIQRYVKDGSLRMGHARALLATPDRAFQEQLARKAVNDDLSCARSRRRSAPRAGVTVAPRAGTAARRRRPDRVRELRPPGLLELEELLGDYLETEVQITMGPSMAGSRSSSRPRGSRADLIRLIDLVRHPCPAGAAHPWG